MAPAPSNVVVSRNGQVHSRDTATRKAIGPLLGWVERDPQHRRYWIAESIAGGRIATDTATRHEALRTLLQHVRDVQTSVLAADVDTGPINIRTRGSLTHWGHHIGAWIGGLAMIGTAVLLVYAISLT